MEDFVGSLIGGENMGALTSAMDCVSTVMGTVTADTVLSCLAFGFLLAKGGVKVVKRLAHLGG